MNFSEQSKRRIYVRRCIKKGCENFFMSAARRGNLCPEHLVENRRDPEFKDYYGISFSKDELSGKYIWIKKEEIIKKEN